MNKSKATGNVIDVIDAVMEGGAAIGGGDVDGAVVVACAVGAAVVNHVIP